MWVRVQYRVLRLLSLVGRLHHDRGKDNKTNPRIGTIIVDGTGRGPSVPDTRTKSGQGHDPRINETTTVDRKYTATATRVSRSTIILVRVERRITYDDDTSRNHPSKWIVFSPTIVYNFASVPYGWFTLSFHPSMSLTTLLLTPHAPIILIHFFYGLPSISLYSYFTRLLDCMVVFSSSHKSKLSQFFL